MPSAFAYPAGPPADWPPKRVRQPPATMYPALS
jgi:hypothetical protein